MTRPPSTWRLLGAFLRRDFQIERSYGAHALMGAAAWLISLAIYFYISKAMGTQVPALASQGGSYFRFALIGLAVLAMARGLLMDLSRKVREAQVQGSLEPLFAYPLHPILGVALIGAFPLLQALARAVAMIAIGPLLFGVDLSRMNLLSGLAALLLSATSLLGFALLGTASVLTLKRGDPFGWALTSASTLLSGIFFPVELLPPFLRAASALSPLTYSASALRGALVLGQGVAELRGDLGALALFSVCLIPLSLAALGWAARRVLSDGSLGHA